jgi:hypothetical protein
LSTNTATIDERCILHDSLLHLEVHSGKLPLQLIPHFFVHPVSVRRSLNFHIVVESGTTSIVPRNILNECDRLILVQVVRRETAKLLNKQRLEHQNQIDVRPPTTLDIVIDKTSSLGLKPSYFIFFPISTNLSTSSLIRSYS